MRRDPVFAAPKNGHVDILLNFADDPVNLYQVRQWYAPLEQLGGDFSVAIFCHRPETAKIIASETTLKVVLAQGLGNLKELRERIAPKVVLYPNQNYNNYAVLGLTNAQHVFISHGESDKIYMASNWMKVFNYFFVAGEASRQRLSTHLLNYDVDKKTMEIGRPQIDMPRPSPLKRRTTRTTILYAPTWEGGRPSMRYGSVATHGVSILSGLLADGRFRVIYRPHPRTGVQDAEVARADAEARGMLANAIARDPAAQHMIDAGVFGWQLDVADVMITDISAVAYDWLTTGKPILITIPSAPETTVTQTGFISDMPMLAECDAADVVRIVDQVRKDDELGARIRRWADFYYGDRTPGASMTRFKRALERTISERDEWGRDELAPELHQVKPSFPVRDVVKNSWEALLRRISREKAEQQAAQSLQDVHSDGSVDLVLCSMASPAGAKGIIKRIPEVEALASSRSIALVVGNYMTYLKLRRRTYLPVYLGAGSGQTEMITKALSPFAVLYLEQAKHNLRETAYHGMFHVYWGNEQTGWINNRLNGFDYVLVDDEWTRDLVLDSLGNRNADLKVVNLSAQELGGISGAISSIRTDFTRARREHPDAFMTNLPHA
ncbi:CDP-glycerol glycerophosphotransferase family protein [Arthrobacter sp. 179]|uniref:CDP-glycerol glycerophosphotransferase family protein n=1 Tax=Arthrobacter sp. 179 TaxID=3457734 RepID=UPI0040334DB9